MELKFGKFKGKNISEVNASYLEWLECQDFTSAALKKAIRQELEARYELFEDTCEDFDAFSKEERRDLWIRIYLRK